MKVYLDKKNNFGYDYSKDKHMFTVKNTELYDIWEYLGEYYVVCAKNKGYAVAESISLNPEGEKMDGDNIICPYCAYENRYSDELDGDSGEIECTRCGAIMGYEKEVHVRYTTNPVRRNAIKLADGCNCAW